MSAEIAARRNFTRIGATRPRTEIEAAHTRLPAVNFVRIGSKISNHRPLEPRGKCSAEPPPAWRKSGRCSAVMRKSAQLHNCENELWKLI